MKIISLYIFSVIVADTSFGQATPGDSLQTQEYNFFYKDSIDGKIFYGAYESTGLVSFQDGSLIISTRFSIFFHDLYQIPDSFTNKNFKVYYEEQNKIRDKKHISSGSVFKLNPDFKKAWEIFFVDKRVEKISKLPDQSVIVAGERVDMAKFWMAHIDTSGNILWEKEYKLRHKSTIANMVIDSAGNSYLLAEADALSPVSTVRHYGRKRIRLFKLSEKRGNIIYLLKITSKGNVLWKRRLDTDRNYLKYGAQLFLDKSIYAVSYYNGLGKFKNTRKKDKKQILYEVNRDGKILRKFYNDNHFYYHNNGLRFSVKPHKNTLTFYTAASDSLVPTLTFSPPVNTIWISGYISLNKSTYLLGSKDHNLGCMIVRLDSNNNYTGYWADNSSVTKQLVDAIVKPDGTVVVISEASKKSDGTGDRSVRYINLTVIEKGSIKKM